MSRYPKRDEYTYWHNEEPVADVHEALEFLSTDSPLLDKEFHLRRGELEGHPWELIGIWYHGGSSGGESSGHHYYQIETEVAETLVREGLVAMRREPRMGYTYIHENELVISRAGRQMLEVYLTEMRAKAESLLKPGVHTDLTGKPDYAGHDRDGYRCGKLYFEFRVPNGAGCCRVYPEEGRLLEPEEVNAAA